MKKVIVQEFIAALKVLQHKGHFVIKVSIMLFNWVGARDLYSNDSWVALHDVPVVRFHALFQALHN